MNSTHELIRTGQVEELFCVRNCLSYVCLFSHCYQTSYLKDSVFIVMAELVIKNVSHRMQSVWQKTYAVLNFKTLVLKK